MNESFNSQAYSYMRDHRSGETNLDAAYLFVAQDRFSRAASRAWFYRLIAFILKKRYRLINLGAYEIKIVNRLDLGIQPVEISDIKGSESKAGDFDILFHPTNKRTYHRWISIALARQRFETIPPVDLLRIQNLFFVRDGHHRVSVARAFGEEVIDAKVTHLSISPPIPWDI